MNSTTNMATLHNGLRPRKKPSKILQNFFFAELYTKITNSFNKREHNFVIFVIFHSCLFKIRSVYIKTIYADEKNVLLCILAF